MALKFLGEEQGNIKVYHNEELTMSPIYPLFLRGIAKLISSGNRETYKSWDDAECGAVYAQIENEIIGHIVYNKENKKVLVIAESSIEDQYRNQGIYKLLFKHLESIAKELDCWAISASIHVDDLEMIHLLTTLGMTSSSYKMMKKL